MSATQIVTLVDFEQPGKQLGRLAAPQSTNTSGWTTEYLPIAVINGAPGPTALLFGGNHGDEYEGPVTLLNLAHTLEPDRIRGRIIMLPMLNRPALAAGARLSPLDGKNMNSGVPGARRRNDHRDDCSLRDDGALSAGRPGDRYPFRRTVSAFSAAGQYASRS
jgi:predicted deacylase